MLKFPVHKLIELNNFQEQILMQSVNPTPVPKGQFPRSPTNNNVYYQSYLTRKPTNKKQLTRKQSANLREIISSNLKSDHVRTKLHQVRNNGITK